MHPARTAVGGGWVGARLGTLVGPPVGRFEGITVGAVGLRVGRRVGIVGRKLGRWVGPLEAQGGGGGRDVGDLVSQRGRG
jgi:hypothetical protein